MFLDYSEDDPLRVEKGVTGFTVEDGTFYGGKYNDAERRKRGLSVYNYSALVSQAARDRYGRIQSAEYLVPYFSLTVAERIDMARACGTIFGVVTGRMNTISGLDWNVTKKSNSEDKIAFQLKTAKQLIDEFSAKSGGEDSLASLQSSVRNRAVVNRCKQFLTANMRDLLDDLSNFDRALLRWSHRIKQTQEAECGAVEDWMRRPNAEDTIEDFVKKLVFDEHVHGIASVYKLYNGGKIDKLYLLPGGSCFPIHGRHIASATGVVQIVDGAEAQLFYQDEVSTMQYAPYSGDPYGLIPVEALVNKVAEMLLFDERAALMADGTRPPDKLIAFGEKTPWGNLQSAFEMPLNKAEQKRMETVINEWRKEAVRVISGHGTPAIVDISRADTFQHQSERQRMVREEVGLVFGASNAELNLSGSEGTSGRDSSKTQERKDQYKGIYPHVQMLENFWNYHIFPYRYGDGYEFKYDQQVSEKDQVDMWAAMLQSGLYSVNEIRKDEMGMEPFADSKFDIPGGAGGQSPEAGDQGMQGGMGGLGMGDFQ